MLEPHDERHPAAGKSDARGPAAPGSVAQGSLTQKDAELASLYEEVDELGPDALESATVQLEASDLEELPETRAMGPPKKPSSRPMASGT